jgi:serine/threonine-protein kinase
MIAGLEILNLHAQGGMAEVYRARGKGSDGRTWHYAVKRILPELTENKDLRQMFVEEARVASLLVHPNIVRVYDLARSENDDFFIVMEFLEGRDLAEAIDRSIDLGRNIPVWMAIHIAREVLAALTYATTQATDREGRPLALIHRDISPHNIFVCFDGQVKLTDFGVAKVAQSSVHTQVGVTKGKFGYMSPEQLTSSEKLDFRSDLYNVGILLYETLTGRRLFFGNNPSQFLTAMIRNEVPALDPALRVPPELDALMRRALSRERENRPPNAAAFEAELRAIAERYGLLATRDHIANELRGIFGSEIESCPVPQPAAVLPQRLASISAALPEVVKRAEVPKTPQRIPSNPQIFPPQQRARGLSDPSVDVPLAPVSPPARETSGPNVRPGTRSVRPLPDPGEPPKTTPIKREALRPVTDPKRKPRLASAESSDKDPSTIPPDAKPAETSSSSHRRPTVIVGGGSARPLAPADEKPQDDDWELPTDSRTADLPALQRGSSVVTRSPRVVPLPAKKP